MKGKNKLIYICSILLVIVLVIIFFFSYEGLKEKIKNKQENIIYAKVLESGKNYIKIKNTKNDDIYYLNYDKNNLNTGEIVAITYKDKVDKYQKIDVIVDSEEDIIITDNSSSFTTTSTSIKNSTTTTTRMVAAITSTSISFNEDQVVDSFKTSYMNIKDNKETSIGQNIKEKFIEIIDFVFYGSEIKGYTFNSLSENAKSKVLYYALLIDQTIDNKWPDYKKNISSKYQDMKAKLLAKYLDISTSICSKEENARYCGYVKSDIEVLKYSLNLTWDTVKKAFKFGYDKTTDALIKWYEMFSGKV